MKIYFYTFSKKYNSTARPAQNSGHAFDCVLKSDTGVISPTIELNIGLVVNPSSYNFAYIPDFDRYYWVTEWDFVQSMWIASLSVDVLATWKPYIGDTSMYVYRSSYEYDGNIPDKMYSTTSDLTYVSETVPTNSVSLKDGYYIVSIYGANNNSAKTVSYYTFSSANFATFINKVYAYLGDDGLWGTIVTGVRNSIYNIADYIGTCYWSPRNPADSNEAVTSIDIGNYTMTGLSANRINVTTEGVCMLWRDYVAIPKNPIAQTRGNCYNFPPYAKYKLTYMPFGVMNLDGVQLSNFAYLGLEVGVDGVTGEALLTLALYNGTLGNLTDRTQLAVISTHYLVEIPLVYSKSNVFGAMQNAQYEAINQTYASKTATATLTTLHAVQSAWDLMVPDPDVNGNVGGLAKLNYSHNCLVAIFLGVTDEDNDSNGRPLCKVRLPKNIPGYIEGESNSFSAPATETEMAEVKRFIENGFYYE